MTKSFDHSDYSTYKQDDFKHRWLRPEHLYSKLEKYRSFEIFRFSEFGQSEEGKPLIKIEYGNGPLKIMLWTQMHGNEPTATLALVDLLHFLSSHGDLYDNFRKHIASHFTLLMIPMLNPDGAERFRRRNALNIDMNRDALSLQTLEIRAFVDLFKQFKPHWAFNMHDQRNFFSAGNSKNPATISFLSASADINRKLTPTREKSMKLISILAEEVVEEVCPGHCGRYSDEFYPRALGEFFHQQEVPCVLVESGAYPNDPFRDKARKLNFLVLLKAFENLMEETYLEYDTRAYFAIPENGKNIMDLCIRNCILEKSGSRVDLGFMLEEYINTKSGELLTRYRLTDIGDLSFQHGFIEFEGGYIDKNQQLDLEKTANLKIANADEVVIEIKEGKIL